MGRMEAESRRRTKRVNIENIVFGTLAVAGVAALAMAAPNTLQLLKHVDPDWMSKRDPRRRLRETISRMKRKGLVEFKMHNGKNRPRLTKKGEDEARRINLGKFQIKKPLRWDQKWRIVIFDIPEKRKGLREHVRRLVFSMGFFRLQDSIWVFPYDCEEVVTLLKLELKIGTELIYIIADAIEFDKPLRQHFELPLD